MTTEDRLRDAMAAYRDQARAPDRLLDEIQVRAGRRTPPGRVLVGVAAALLVLVVGLAVALRADGESTSVGSGRRTHADLLAQAEESCAQIQRSIEQASPVFQTPAAYAVVADQRLAIAQSALLRIEAFPRSPDTSWRVEAAAGQIRSAITAAERASQHARGGDLSGARAALLEYEAAMARSGAQLASIGASGCAAPTEEDR